MAMTRQKCKNDCIIHSTLDELVPQEHLVRKLDNCIDFTFIEELVKDLYSVFGVLRNSVDLEKISSK